MQKHKVKKDYRTWWRKAIDESHKDKKNNGCYSCGIMDFISDRLGFWSEGGESVQIGILTADAFYTVLGIVDSNTMDCVCEQVAMMTEKPLDMGGIVDL